MKAKAPIAKAGENKPPKILTGAAIIFFTTLLVYLPAMGAGFIWDDDAMLTANPLVQAPGGLRALWFTTQAADYWPLTYTSLWVEWRCWGMNPMGYHVTNIVLHALAAVLLWRGLLQLRIPGAWLAALIFAIHPVNVESVAWITERKNALSLFFCLLAGLSYLRFDAESRAAASGSRSTKWFYLALLTFTLSLLAKTSTVMLPGGLMLCLWWRQGRVERRDLIRLAPFFAVSAVMGLATIWFQTYRAIDGDVVRTDSFATRLAGAGWAVCFYVTKALAPVNLSFVYPRWDVSARGAFAWVPLGVVVGVFLILYKNQPRWGRAGLFALGWFLLMLLPVLGFFDIYFFRYSLVADHWQYFSIAAILALVVGGLSHTMQNASRSKGFANSASQLVAVTVVLGLALLTWRRASTYANAETLWRDTLKKNPQCWLALNNLGLELAAQGKMSEATSLYLRSLEINPHQMEAHNNLGETLASEGQNEAARESFLRAQARAPRSAMVQLNLAKLAEREGDVEAARAAYRRTLELAPANVDGHNGLGSLLGAQGKLPEALAEFQSALRSDPQHVAAQFNAGNVSFALGKTAEAMDYYRATVRLRPDHVEAHYNLSLMLARSGRAAEAITHLERILQIQPDNITALSRLALILATHGDAKLRDGPRALKLAGRAVELSGQRDPTLLDVLAAAYAETGQFPRALAVAQTAGQSAIALGKTNQAARIQEHLAAYQSGRPWRE